MRKYKIWYQLNDGSCNEFIAKDRNELFRVFRNLIVIGIQELKVELYDERGER